MLLAERHRRILVALEGGGRTVRDLAGTLDVSQSTIRRDLEALDREGRLERHYGGAILTRGSRAVVTDSGEIELPIGTELAAGHEATARVAAAGAELVRDGDVVILDIGTSTALLAEHLRGRAITVITTSLAVFDRLRDDERIELVLLGGVLRRNYQSLVGPITEHALAELGADLMFLSCTGVRGDRVLDNMAVEVPIKKGLLRAAERVALLATAAKFPGDGSMRLCSLDEVDVLVTTSDIPKADLDARRAAGGKVILA